MIAGHYAVRFRAQLNNETDPAKRIALRRLLVKEEDRLGANFELLAEVQQVIIDCKQRIAELRYLVGNMKVDGRDASVVERWLETQKDLRALHETYSRKLQSKLYSDGAELGAKWPDRSSADHLGQYRDRCDTTKPGSGRVTRRSGYGAGHSRVATVAADSQVK
jgi:hypothetical protein